MFRAKIPGCSRYYIFSDGRIYSTIKSRFLTRYVSKIGYVQVTLKSDEGPLRKFYLHRLLALCFLPQIEGKTSINHINGIKTDNRLDNLEWCTHQENMIHAVTTGLSVSAKGFARSATKLRSKDLPEIIRMLEAGWDQREIGAKFNLSSSTICSINTGKRFKAESAPYRQKPISPGYLK